MGYILVFSLANSSTFSILLAHPTTFIPSLASSLQIAAPIPALAPVTTATRPLHRSMIMFCTKIIYVAYKLTKKLKVFGDSQVYSTLLNTDSNTHLYSLFTILLLLCKSNRCMKICCTTNVVSKQIKNVHKSWLCIIYNKFWIICTIIAYIV